MIAPLLDHPALAGAACLALLAGCVLCLYRVAAGPSAPDRAAAVGVLGAAAACLCAVLALVTGLEAYMNAALAMAALVLPGALALARHLEGRPFDE
ncbi:MAG TPA: monovalent cation/H+ antiporter complex subunit F [Planctomycetota bacterium]|nr:monovalent cation/H+ antiporter complex subunit F [Planctomycetota bacterium]